MAFFSGWLWYFSYGYVSVMASKNFGSTSITGLVMMNNWSLARWMRFFGSNSCIRSFVYIFFPYIVVGTGSKHLRVIFLFVHVINLILSLSNLYYIKRRDPKEYFFYLPYPSYILKIPIILIIKHVYVGYILKVEVSINIDLLYDSIISNCKG